MSSTTTPTQAADTRGAQVVVITIVCVAFSGCFVILRCVGRFGLLRICGADDILTIVALLCSIGFTVLAHSQYKSGLGLHLDTLTSDQRMSVLKSFWASVIMYYLTLTAVKSSILCQYLRFLVNPNMRRICWIMLVLVLTYGAAATIGSIFACTPVARFWDPDHHPGRCINLMAFWFTNASTNIISDIAIWILPMPVLRSLQLPPRQKYSVILVFALGGCVCIISIIRLYSLYNVSRSTDLTWGNVGAAVWSSIEINVAIICACLPTMKALTNRCLHRPRPTTHVGPDVAALSPRKFTMHSAGVDRDDTLLRPDEDGLYELRGKEDWSSDGPGSAS